ncbi:MAG: outer membrane beta-barrel protein [Prevotella sp.]|nr:outer membrane beta-barrel protein [Prevotella sp.]
MSKHFLLLLLTMVLAVADASAQDDVEYRMEVGGGVGLMGYLGDFNGKLNKNLEPMASVLLRNNLNPYMGFKAALSYGKIKGSLVNEDTYYPEYAGREYKFDNMLLDLNVTYEYNFWPYGTGRDYRGAKRLTPYILLGLGGTFVKTDDVNVVTANVPIGVGVKYKVGARMNVGLEWAMHFTLNDKLDGAKDPYWTTSSGAFKNTDCYSTLQLTLSYSFMAKCRTCHNEDE